MSISFRKIKTKWSSTETIKNTKIALSESKLSKVQTGVLLTVALFAVVYLIQVNALATKGYAIKELEYTIANQKKQNEQIGLEIIEKQSMAVVTGQIAELGFVPSGRIDYITPTASVAVAPVQATR